MLLMAGLLALQIRELLQEWLNGLVGQNHTARRAIFDRYTAIRFFSSPVFVMAWGGCKPLRGRLNALSKSLFKIQISIVLVVSSVRRIYDV